MSIPSTRDVIIELAQEAIAARGYSSFSFRELATELGIKSASIHYHFPTKTHLGVEVARQYRLRFHAALTEYAVGDHSPREALDYLVNIYRHEAQTSQRMTVCMMLATEIKNLPAEIQREMVEFYALNLGWISTQLVHMGLDVAESGEKSRQIFALLQGGLMGAKSQGEPGYFDAVAKGIHKLLEGR